MAYLGLAQKIQLKELTPLWRLVKDNPDKEWEWSLLSENPNITWEIIQNNLDKPWELYYLSMNTFSKEIQQIKLQLQTKAAIKIQRWYVNIYFSPKNYKHILMKNLRDLGRV